MCTNTRNTSANNDVHEFDAKLRAALEALEMALATPLVEGELSEWSRHLQNVWNEAAALVRLQIDVIHTKQFEEIGKADPEMFKRIEEMEREDEAIRGQLATLTKSVEFLNRRLPVAEGDPTAPVNDEQNRVVNDGLAFVTRVRKQEVVVTTWLLEAFRRERGIAD